MKKLLLTTAIVMSFSTTAAFAHHPAADMVDPVIYEMIDTNLIDTPHYDMEFDDDMGGDGSVMNGDTTDVGSTRSSIASDFANYGADTAADRDDVARDDVAGAEMDGLVDIEAAAESRMIDNSVADAVPSGPGAQR